MSSSTQMSAKPEWSRSTEALEFLDEFTRYLNWRLHPAGDSQSMPPLAFEQKFKAFLDRLGGYPEDETYQGLVSHMATMKETRGPLHPKPKPPA